jgi:hypothetical protein
MKKLEEKDKFKQYVHERLNKMGVPENPEPENNLSHGCRIEGRINFVEKEIAELREKLANANEVIRYYTTTTGDIEGIKRREALNKYNNLKP